MDGERHLFSSSHELVALLGIAHRQIHVKFSHKLRKQNYAKPLPERIKTIGDWIQVKRREKNLTSCHLAAKMGIPTALVRSWEDGNSQPDSKQMKVLASLFGYGADFDPTKKDAFATPIFPREPGKGPAAY
jgi:ribosome-binding protein aMBF1 (putative translation factor)